MRSEIDINEGAWFSGRAELATALREQGLEEVPHIVAYDRWGSSRVVFVVPMVHPDRARWQKLAELHDHTFITSC